MSERELRRTEFGYTRTVCGCGECTTNCRFMPGFLIPADLDRLFPDDGGLDWAAANLLASPGALVMRGGETFRIPTLVPATKPDGTCVNLSNSGLCQIHAAAPFGCAFFDCGPERGNLSKTGLMAVVGAWVEFGRLAERDNTDAPGILIDISEKTPYRYAAIWQYLWSIGKRQKRPDELRARMAAATALNRGMHG
jgi:hypothetical protein